MVPQNWYKNDKELQDQYKIDHLSEKKNDIVSFFFNEWIYILINIFNSRIGHPIYKEIY